MTNNFNHFIGTLITINNRAVKVYGVVIRFRGEETVKWKIEDGDGKVYSIIIHNANYIP